MSRERESEREREWYILINTWLLCNHEQTRIIVGEHIKFKPKEKYLTNIQLLHDISRVVELVKRSRMYEWFIGIVGSNPSWIQF